MNRATGATDTLAPSNRNTKLPTTNNQPVAKPSQRMCAVRNPG